MRCQAGACCGTIKMLPSKAWQTTTNWCFQQSWSLHVRLYVTFMIEFRIYDLCDSHDATHSTRHQRSSVANCRSYSPNLAMHTNASKPFYGQYAPFSITRKWIPKGRSNSLFVNDQRELPTSSRFDASRHTQRSLRSNSVNSSRHWIITKYDAFDHHRRSYGFVGCYQNLQQPDVETKMLQVFNSMSCLVEALPFWLCACSDYKNHTVAVLTNDVFCNRSSDKAQEIKCICPMDQTNGHQRFMHRCDYAFTNVLWYSGYTIDCAFVTSIQQCNPPNVDKVQHWFAYQ